MFVQPEPGRDGNDALVFVQAHKTEGAHLTGFRSRFERVPAGQLYAQSGHQIMLRMQPGDRLVCVRSWSAAEKDDKGAWQLVPKTERTSIAYDGEELRSVTGVSFRDIIGQEEAKERLSTIVRYLKNAKRLQQIGARFPRGVLLTGEPGNGKTMLVQAMASEADVAFFSMNGSDFVNTYVGVGASNVRELFKKARAANRPAIIFIDELDAVASKRPSGATESGGSQEYAGTVTALLTEMNGFTEHPHPIIVIGATNRPDAIDRALLRPGRIDRKVRVGNPKQPDLVKLYAHYTENLPLAAGIDPTILAQKSIGLSASSVANVCNEAALMLFDSDVDGKAELKVTQELLEKAIANEHKQYLNDSKAKRFQISEQSIKLVDVIGQEAAKDDIQDVVKYLKDPESFKKHGAKVPRGTLFVGPPGEGKTHLARAVAGEAGVPFFSISGSEFVEKFVGVGAARVREVFEEARRNAPCILFIDEIDAMGKQRGRGMDGGGTDERESTLNQLLVEMDGFNQQPEPVIVLAATNRMDILDSALLRPGRFDRQAYFSRPDYADRLKLFQYYFRDKRMTADVNLEFFAHNTFGFSAADIQNLSNEATLLMVRNGEEELTPAVIDAAIIRVTVGSPRKNRMMSDEQKLNTATHEVWHAIAWHVESNGAPIARITIQPAGNSGGHVQTQNDDDPYVTKKKLLARITMAQAARLGQEIILDTIDTGASSDLRQASQLAYAMVSDYGMSELGNVAAVDGVARSPSLVARIERTVERILRQCDDRARQIIAEHRRQADVIVKELLLKETLLGNEFVALFNSVPATPVVVVPEVPAPSDLPCVCGDGTDCGAQACEQLDSELPAPQPAAAAGEPKSEPTVIEVIEKIASDKPVVESPKVNPQETSPSPGTVEKPNDVEQPNG